MASKDPRHAGDDLDFSSVLDSPPAPTPAPMPLQPAPVRVPVPRAAAPAPAPKPAAPPPGKSSPPKKPVALIAGVALLLAAAIGGGAYVFSRRGPAEVQKPVAQVSTVRGVTATEIKIGSATALTGTNKERGRSVSAGWEAAFAAVNAAGGVHGRKLLFDAVDDGYDPKKTPAAMQQLVETDKVFAVVGNVGSSTAAAILPYVNQQKVVFFAPGTGGSVVRKNPPDHWVFTTRASLGEEAAAAVRYLTSVRTIPADKLGLLVQKDEFGESGFAGAVAELETLGVGAASVPRMEYERGTSDVSDALQKLKDRGANIKAMILVATYKPASTFIRKVREGGNDLPIVVLSTDPTAIGQELAEVGAKATENVVLTQIVPLPTSNASGVARFRTTMSEYAPDKPAGGSSLEGWIAAQVFIEALRQAGPDLNEEKLVAAIEGLTKVDLGTGAVFSFSKTKHQGTSKVWGWAMQPDGSYQQIDLD